MEHGGRGLVSGPGVSGLMEVFSGCPTSNRLTAAELCALWGVVGSDETSPSLVRQWSTEEETASRRNRNCEMVCEDTRVRVRERGLLAAVRPVSTWGRGQPQPQPGSGAAQVESCTGNQHGGEW